MLAVLKMAQWELTVDWGESIIVGIEGSALAIVALHVLVRLCQRNLFQRNFNWKESLKIRHSKIVIKEVYQSCFIQKIEQICFQYNVHLFGFKYLYNC